MLTIPKNKHPLNIISKYRFAQAQCKCDRIPKEEYPHKYNIDFGFSTNKHECHGQCHYNCQATWTGTPNGNVPDGNSVISWATTTPNY